MKKAIIGLVAMVLSLVGGGAAFAVETGHIVGNSEGGIEITGHLGVDNTKENPIISYGDDWINVWLPIDTVFYNVKGNLGIRSPSYAISNLSARGVKITVKTFENLEFPNETLKIKQLNLKSSAEGGPEINLINEGRISTESAGVEIATLPSGAHDEDVTFPKEARFVYEYVGSVNAPLDTPSTPKYQLVLNFQAL